MSSSELLLQVKEEIKKELIQELKKTVYLNYAPKPWVEVRRLMESRLAHYSSYDRYKITTAIGTIVRFTFGLDNVLNLSEDDVPKAKEIVLGVIEIMHRNLETRPVRGGEEGWLIKPLTKS